MVTRKSLPLSVNRLVTNKMYFIFDNVFAVSTKIRHAAAHHMCSSSTQKVVYATHSSGIYDVMRGKGARYAHYYCYK